MRELSINYLSRAWIYAIHELKRPGHSVVATLGRFYIRAFELINGVIPCSINLELSHRTALSNALPGLAGQLNNYFTSKTGFRDSQECN